MAVVMRPQPGEIVQGKYRIVRQLADGGMGTIYEATHEVLGTSVALKFLHTDLARRPGLVARFLQEARVSATLRSPHIVQVLDVEQDERGAFLVMELLRGETLQQFLDRQHRIELPTAIDFTLQMLAALDVAHSAGVVHRDLKPDNVFLLPTVQGALVKVLDFGIAKLKLAQEAQVRGLTRPGVTMGTPEYMAPEQAFSADTVDGRADLYSLGVMLFEMITGQRPVGGEEPKAIAQKVYAGQVIALSAIDPKLPMELVVAVHKAMAPMPHNRFASAQEMSRALLPFARTQVYATSHTPPPATGPMTAWPASQAASASAAPAGASIAQPLTRTPPLTQQHGYGPAPAGQSASPQQQPTHPQAHAQAPTYGQQQPLPQTSPQAHAAAHGYGQTAPIAPLRPDAGARPGQVPKTLPPEHEPAEPAFASTTPYEPLPQVMPHTNTVQAQPLWRQSAPPTTPGAPPSFMPSGYGEPPSPQQTAIAPFPLQQPAPGYFPPPAAQPQYTPAPPQYTPAPPYVAGSRGRGGGMSTGLIAVLAALAGGLLVVGVIALQKKGDSGGEGPDPMPTNTVPIAPVTIGTQTSSPLPSVPTQAPTALPTVVPTATAAPTSTATATPRATATATTGSRDAGAPVADAGPDEPVDAGRRHGLPFPNIFDGGLPPLPSALPPVTITIPFPGFPQ